MFRILVHFLVTHLAVNCQFIYAKENSSEEQVNSAAKINWRPVWQEHQEHESNPIYLRSLEKYGEQDLTQLDSKQVESLRNDTLERDGETCSTLNGIGIQRLISEARKLLPAERLRNILANAAEDPEVSRLRALIHSDAVQNRLTRLRSSAEHRIVYDFVCRQLNLNYGQYIDFIREVLNINLNESPASIIPNSRPGIRGLLRDLRDALPRQQLRELYRRLVATDRDLATAVQRLKSSEFRLLLRSYRSRREYREIRSLLEREGVPMNTIQQLVATALGWGEADIGAETTILNV